MKTYFLIILLFVAMQLSAQDRVTGRAFATRSEVIAQHGMVCTSQPLVTQIGIDILKQGGSAIDAAIACDAALGLMEPTGSGVGGDLFAIIWDAKTKKLYGLNASGRSPKSLTKEILLSKGIKYIPSTGPLPVSVPGCVDGWFELNKKFGKLPMKQLLSPAIKYAKEGFPVSELIAYYMGSNSRSLSQFPNIKETYMPNGNPPKKGEIFKNPFLANTLQKISDGGRDAFYKGDIAHTIDAFMKKNGGYLSFEDMASHKSEWVEPLSTNYRGYDVWELPPNSQGIAALQMLNMMEAYDVKSMGFGSADYVHLFVEAKKLAFEDRAKFYADPAFNQLPIKQLISKDYAAERRKLIDMSRSARRVMPGNPEHGNTIYLTVADEEGNMVSFIQSNYRGMGSGMCPDGLGFIFQDRGEMFTLEDNHVNTYQPGKRPFQTIIPCFITKDGKPWVSFGVMGGAMQPQGHVQIVCNLIDFGMNLQEAGDAPRIQHDFSSEPTGQKSVDQGLVYLESGFSYETIRALMQRGHKIQFDLGGYGGYQAIMYDDKNKTYIGASESRKDGQAAGY
jgi:gamma-glutamyltranspeptidase / glutathione hydrolase